MGVRVGVWVGGWVGVWVGVCLGLPLFVPPARSFVVSSEAFAEGRTRAGYVTVFFFSVTRGEPPRHTRRTTALLSSTVHT